MVTSPATTKSQAPVECKQVSKQVIFGMGKLGLMTHGVAGERIEIVYCVPDGQADCKGLSPGDVVTGINGKPLSELMFDAGDSEEFGRVVTRTRAAAPEGAITLEARGANSDGPHEVLRVNEENVSLQAGVMYKRGFQVTKGQTLRLRFFTSEADVDIGFAIEQEDGHGHVFAPTRGRWSQHDGQSFGPTCFTMPRDGKVCLVWDNSHSWVRGKTLSYFCELLPAQTEEEKAALLAAERAHLQKVIGLVDQKVAKAEALLAAEKGNREGLRKRLAEVNAHISEVKSHISEANGQLEGAQGQAQGQGQPAHGRVLAEKAQNENDGPDVQVRVQVPASKMVGSASKGNTAGPNADLAV